MSDVTRIACTICTPSAADRNGIRRLVSVTSQELTGLIQHFLEAHYAKADVAISTANEALNMAQKTVDLINDQAEFAIRVEEGEPHTNYTTTRVPDMKFSPSETSATSVLGGGDDAS